MAYLLGQDDNKLLGITDEFYLTDGLDDRLSTLDFQSTVISQYSNSPVINAILETFADAMDPSPTLAAFYDYVWNVDTAVGHGLDIWGRIVDVSRVLTLPHDDRFLRYGHGQTDFVLTDDQFRILIMVKAASNISGMSAPLLNSLLRKLFPDRGRIYSVDLEHMLSMFTAEFDLTALEYLILTQSGALPRPAGVGLFLLQIDPPTRFGFGEGGYQTFGFGTFYGDPDAAF